MEESRKRVLLIAAAILAARKLASGEVRQGSPAYLSVIASAIFDAETIMKRIDRGAADEASRKPGWLIDRIGFSELRNKLHNRG